MLEHQIGGGTLVATKPPAPLHCKELGFGWIMSKPLAKTDTQVRLDPLRADQSIGAMVTISDLCTDEGCETLESAHEASEKLTACLQSEFGRRKLDLGVHDMAQTLSSLPVPSGQGSRSSSHAALLAQLRMPVNRDHLASLGVRYVISTDMLLQKGTTARVLEHNQLDIDEIFEGNIESIIPLSTFTTTTRYVSSLSSSIIDVTNGEVVGTIMAEAEGSTGAIVPVIVIIPVAYVPYGSRARIQSNACSSMARRLTFTLRGGVSGWPEEYFQDVYAPY
jgi:hypothetical protein